MVTLSSVVLPRDRFVHELRPQRAAWTGMENGVGSLPVERRAKIRFKMTRPLRYRVLKRDFLERVATGRSVDASSNGVLFESETKLKIGDPLELLIDWPVSLNDRVPLQLVTAGSVVRVEGNRCAVTVERYEFRTRAMVSSGKC
jgi:hypothetical protein